ncbi:MAG TPA: hypothetical protein VG269_12370 [Tepidisphaeraceae bacterium]|nr:hypothetical protein [Tepidisphaeraceae bacterium]
MASRTQIVCLCEGVKGESIDEVFINKLVRTIRPIWVRPQGTNYMRIEPCGGRSDVIARMPAELRSCLNAGGDTTLMVWADCDDNCADGEALKGSFRQEAQRQGITTEQFDRVVFIFAKDRLENWIEFLQTGNTDESKEGPRVKHNRTVADAAKKLADFCRAGKLVDGIPPSLQWSCRNWRALAERMR